MHCNEAVLPNVGARLAARGEVRLDRDWYARCEGRRCQLLLCGCFEVYGKLAHKIDASMHATRRELFNSSKFCDQDRTDTRGRCQVQHGNGGSSYTSSQELGKQPDASLFDQPSGPAEQSGYYALDDVWLAYSDSESQGDTLSQSKFNEYSRSVRCNSL